MRVCICCGYEKPLDEFGKNKGIYKTHTCSKCAYKKRKARQMKPVQVARPVRHPWEALGADIRPVWSKL